ncbi:right-handed parallel beta-helix repeat-containing protein, partial [Christiangramia sabulilitoris]
DYYSRVPGTVIENNVIENSGYRGVHLQYQSGFIFNNNSVSIQPHYNGTSLWVSDSEGGGEIINNRLIGGGPGYHGVYLGSCQSPVENPGLIANNVIANSSEQSIQFGGNTNYRVYHNSVNNQGGGRAFRMGSGSGNELRNNIFRSNSGYAIEVYNSSGISSSDYNDFFTSGGYLGRWGNTNIPDLPTWQATSNSLSQIQICTPRQNNFRMQEHLFQKWQQI